MIAAPDIKQSRHVPLAALVLFTTPAAADPAVYDPASADQYEASRLPDSVPARPEARRLWARHLAYEAAIYGVAAVLEYRQLHAQAIDPTAPGFTGFNRFAHGRDLAGPDFRPFKTPNADTLYSNAWLDLSGGPVLLEVPDTAGRYYTAAVLDMHGNASNISARTAGTAGGRYLTAPPDWPGAAPEGAPLFRVPTPLTWFPLRGLVDRPADLPMARALQDRFALAATASARPEAVWPDGKDESAAGFFRILDFILRTCGIAKGEEAMVHGWEGIGLGGTSTLDDALADPEIRAGIEQGHVEAQQVIAASMGKNGQRSGSWTQPVDLGRYGYNYLYRAAINTLGTGANVIDENHPFTSFHDAAGAPLDGSGSAAYELRLAPPPPARFFWSVTVYDQRSRALYPNPLGKYVVGDRTPGLVRGADGSVAIRLQHATVNGKAAANWLPVPNGPFYVVIRAQGPGPEIATGAWSPPPIRRLLKEAIR